MSTARITNLEQRVEKLEFLIAQLSKTTQNTLDTLRLHQEILSQNKEELEIHGKWFAQMALDDMARQRLGAIKDVAT